MSHQGFLLKTVISVGKSYLEQKAKPVRIKKNQIQKREIPNSKKQLENLDRNKLLANELSVCFTHAHRDYFLDPPLGKTALKSVIDVIPLSGF